MKLLSIASLAVLTLTMIFVSCGPPKGGVETVSECYPVNLKVGVDDGLMSLRWQTLGDRIKGGYFVYLSDEPLVEHYPEGALPKSVKPFNHTAFPGDTEPEDGIEHFDAEGLENGREYFVSVRVVYPDGTLSQPSNEVAAVCFPHGEMELALRYKADNDGFSFANSESVRADDVTNDLYFYSKDGEDFLASPSRLDGFLRNTRLKKIGRPKDLTEAAKSVVLMSSLPADDRVIVRKGDWLWLRTADSVEKTLVKVLGIVGSGDDRLMKLYYAYGVPFYPQVL